MNAERRAVLRSLAGGSLLMPGIVSELLAGEADPLAPKQPHFTPRAKRVIYLYMSGGAVSASAAMSSDGWSHANAKMNSIVRSPGFSRFSRYRLNAELRTTCELGTKASGG